MTLSRDVVIRLLGDARSAEKAFKASADAAGVSATAYRKAEREHDRLTRAAETSARKQRAAMESVGRGSMLAGAAIVGGLAMATKAAINWESAWTGVRKTVNGSDAELAKLETGLRGLARTLPATHEEIAAVAEAAGQLGVQTGSIVDFTRVMVNLGETTNLTADEAATSLAQMMNVMKTAPGDVDRLGSTLVALGNAGASTEADIMDMSKRLAGAIQLIGGSEADTLALASAMADLGIQSELGGGAMSRVLLKVYSAMQQGGAEAKRFADVAGVSAEEFGAKWKSSPVEAVDMLVQGLGRVKNEGGNVVKTLGDLGIEGTQNLQVMLSLAGAGDRITKSLETGNKGWSENNALIQEAAKRYDTTAAKTEMARNALNDAAIEIGDGFLPILSSLAGGVADVAKWFADLPDPIKGVLSGLSGVAGVGALAGGAFLLLAPRVMESYRAFQLLRTSTNPLASGLGSVGKAAGIAGVVIAATAAVNGLVDSMAKAPPTMAETTDALLGMGESMKQVDTMFKLNSPDVFGKGVNGLADAARELGDPSLLDRLDDFGGELASFGSAEGRASRDIIVKQLGQMGDSLALMVNEGNAELAAKQFDLLAAEWKRGGGTVADLKKLMPAYGEALKGVDNDQKIAAASAQEQAKQTLTLAQTAEASYGSLQGYAAALGLSEDATKDLITQSDALGESLGGFVDPLGTYTGLLQAKAQAEADAANKTAEKTGAATKSWEDFVGDVHVSFDEYLKMLEKQVTDQTNWQTNMLLLAGRVSEGTLSELARMGPEGAPLVADLVNRSDAELGKMDGLFAARSKEATDAWGAQLTMAQPVLAAIAAKGGKGASDAAAKELSAGTKTLAQIAAQWGVSIASGLNPILNSLGKPYIIAGRGGRVGGLTEADGGVVSYYGDGGVESHVAQIAPAGAWRVWAEPETGGEAYIPLASAKRSRSVDIWRETGRRLGVQPEMYAFGGINDVPRPPSTAPFKAPLSTVADSAMNKVYGDTVDWLKTHLAPQLGSGVGWQAQWDAVHAQFPWAQLTSSFRPGAITATGNRSYHSMGRAIDVSPSMEIFDWIAKNYAATELIYSPANGRQEWHGQPHMYGEPTRGDHWDHVHWAMARGGILNPHVRDKGGPLLPGYTFNGLNRPETVMPTTPVGAGAASVTVQARVFIGTREITDIVRVEAGAVVAAHDGRQAINARSWQ